MSRRLKPSERDCLAIVAGAVLPLTQAQITGLLERTDVPWSEATVKRAMSRLVKLGLVQCRARAPRGYVLPAPA